jgi:hypothetical protein
MGGVSHSLSSCSTTARRTSAPPPTGIRVAVTLCGRVRIEETLLDVEPLSSVLVEPDAVRQVFNDTDEQVMWLIVGAPAEHFVISDESHAAERARLYPDGIEALPPELEAGI